MGRPSSLEKHREALLALAADPNVSLTDLKKKFGSGRTRIRRFLEQHGVRREFSKSNRREDHGNWRGGKIVDRDGYIHIYAPDHPHRRKHTPYVAEHRLVMEKHLGRYLDPKEVVHHRNKNKQDNRIENLELFSSNGEHLKHELKGQCPKWSEDGVSRILAGVRRGAVTRKLRNAQKRAERDAAPCSGI